MLVRSDELVADAADRTVLMNVGHEGSGFSFARARLRYTLTEESLTR
ncbi:MAG: hypothetical protein JWN85_3766 [Gammaproteobacteria bacterium]|nr:hypothetical protein [Gammaproteobacteria bacterium]